VPALLYILVATACIAVANCTFSKGRTTTCLQYWQASEWSDGWIPHHHPRWLHWSPLAGQDFLQTSPEPSARAPLSVSYGSPLSPLVHNGWVAAHNAACMCLQDERAWQSRQPHW